MKTPRTSCTPRAPGALSRLSSLSPRGLLALYGLACCLALPAAATELVIATVNNGHMITMQGLTRHYEQSHPGIKLKWVTLSEGALRQQMAADVATGQGQFDVMTIGMLEAPIWGKKGWLREITPRASGDLQDLLPNIRAGLSVDGKLYASPFYGESSMTLVRSDLLAQAGIKLPDYPTWAQIRDAAARLNQPDKGIHGICLRGRPGWGENMTLITTMVNAMGGQWFDMNWRPQLDTKPWHEAVSLYVDLLKRYGPPGSAANGYNENLALFSEGKCAIWVDATVAGGFVNNPARSKVAGKVSFLQAPQASTTKGSRWLWAWALAVPKSSTHAPQALDFVRWATSREYIKLVASQEGWGAVPSGTRLSTYANAEFMKANAYARVEQAAIASANCLDSTQPRSPYVGIQFAAIPEFQAIGTAVGQQISNLLTDGGSVDDALARSQALSLRKMRDAGYLR
jgi:sorbitol/mannitol transport system substrate-binding protein